MTEFRAVALLVVTLALAAALGCPETPAPSWPEQHHAGVR